MKTKWSLILCQKLKNLPCAHSNVRCIHFGEWISGWFTLGILKGVQIASGSCRKVAMASGRGDGGRGDPLSVVTTCKIKQLYVQPFQVSVIPTY